MAISHRHIGAVLVAVLTSACASGRGESPGTEATPAAAPASSAASSAELEALFRARADSARMRFTEADVRFMTGMIAHHAQALAMAALVPSRSGSAAIRTLAARIENAQQDEIVTMQQWLRDRSQPVPELHVMDGEPMIHGADHGLMPGMLTPEQMQRLKDARGTEFDRRFLASMIQHHRGAVRMVRELFATDGAGQDEAVFKFASDVQVDQTTEIDRMQLMLDALPAESGDPTKERL